jgi:zinc D-Ala-D-Ala carboxypeptidase
MYISKHLELAELTRSESAKRNGISNMPTPEHVANLKKLADNIFEKIREHFDRPILISSGYRSIDLNKIIKGSKTSQHSTGEAIDIDMDGTDVTNKEIFDYIKKNLSFDQLIWEFGTDKNPDWVHVSYESSGKQRKEVLKAKKINGKTIYENI